MTSPDTLKRLERAAMRCWQCGGTLTDPFKRPVEGVERTLPLGEKVRMHKICAETFDLDQIDRIVTARPPEVDYEGAAHAKGRKAR